MIRFNKAREEGRKVIKRLYPKRSFSCGKTIGYIFENWALVSVLLTSTNTVSCPFYKDLLLWVCCTQ